jgi:hypothetical protein
MQDRRVDAGARRDGGESRGERRVERFGCDSLDASIAS